MGNILMGSYYMPGSGEWMNEKALGQLIIQEEKCKICGSSWAICPVEGDIGYFYNWVLNFTICWKRQGLTYIVLLIINTLIFGDYGNENIKVCKCIRLK